MPSRVRYVVQDITSGKFFRGKEAIQRIKQSFRERVGEAADAYIHRQLPAWEALPTWRKLRWVADNAGPGLYLSIYKEKRGVRGNRSQYWMRILPQQPQVRTDRIQAQAQTPAQAQNVQTWRF